MAKEKQLTDIQIVRLGILFQIKPIGLSERAAQQFLLDALDRVERELPIKVIHQNDYSI